MKSLRMSPRVTVGIPFHDEERFLASAIRSVLKQTHADFELLLIDDGSTDRSLEIARGFLHDARVRLFSDGRRRHLGARLNEIVDRARGELIARMDADDLSHPERLDLQVAHLQKHPEAAAVGTWTALIDADARVFGITEASPTPTTGRRVLERGLIPHATMLARASWLRTHRYDERLWRAEDRDLWCRTALRSRVDALEDVLYLIRIVANGPRFLRDYLSGQADLRRVVLRYGPSFMGALPTARLFSASLLKSAAMTVATAVGRPESIVVRRGRKPRPDELARAIEALRASSS